MDRLLLHRFDLQWLKLLVEDLTLLTTSVSHLPCIDVATAHQIHDYTLVDLLPQMGPEYLNERDFERGDLPMHENPRQIKLDLETDVDVGTIDGWAPPECESTIWNLVQTGSLRVCELLVSHGFLETRGLLPEQTLKVNC